MCKQKNLAMFSKLQKLIKTHFKIFMSTFYFPKYMFVKL
jgi:hypothetical protein